MKTKKNIGPQVSDIKVEEIKIFVEKVTKDAEKIKAIKALLPESNQEKISFIIRGTNTATANAIRRCVMSELRWKVLQVDAENVVSTEPFLKIPEFCKRIAFIPIRQNIPSDTKFSISVKNNDAKQNRMIVHSDEIVSSDKKKYFDSTYRIAELHPGNYIKVKDITVREGYSYRMDEPDGANAKFSPVSNVEFYPIDYIGVHMLNEKKQLYSCYVKTADLLAIAPAEVKKLSSNTLAQKKIIIGNGEPTDEFELIKFRNSDYVINSKEAIANVQSTAVMATDYYIAIRTLGNIEPRLLVKTTLQNLVDRLMAMETQLKTAPDTIIDYSSTNEGVTKYRFENEKHTIANMLVTNIYLLDPNIGLVNYNEEHVLKMSFVLVLKHPEPTKILLDAFAKSISDLTIIHSNF
jgi:DNA-directed RNA polymerase subunit L